MLAHPLSLRVVASVVSGLCVLASVTRAEAHDVCADERPVRLVPTRPAQPVSEAPEVHAEPLTIAGRVMFIAGLATTVVAGTLSLAMISDRATGEDESFSWETIHTGLAVAGGGAALAGAGIVLWSLDDDPAARFVPSVGPGSVRVRGRF